MTQQLVRELFKYNDGELYWVIAKKGRKTGIPVGFKNSTGYRQITYNYDKYLVHRIIFLYHNGYMPEKVDHKNGNIDDNRIENLRAATHADNRKNSRKRTKNKSSKYKGVSYYKTKGKWRAQIMHKSVNKHLGLFENELDAALAYNTSAMLYYGEYAALN
jgi:hypothetical protein